MGKSIRPLPTTRDHLFLLLVPSLDCHIYGSTHTKVSRESHALVILAIRAVHRWLPFLEHQPKLVGNLDKLDFELIIGRDSEFETWGT